MRLAVANSDRQILLFDETGERRDKFSTKPAEADADRNSYAVTAIAFGPDSTRLAVAQSDEIVYVYKLGAKWGDKKAICNKFPQPSAILCMVWLSTGPIVVGLCDGKIRELQVKTNKSHSLYGSDGGMVISLASNHRGTGFVSGHEDGSIVRYYMNEEVNSEEPQGKVTKHSVPAYALAWPQGHILVGGCDKRVVVYGASGRPVKQFDYSKDEEEYDFTIACCNSTGQSVVVGSFDRIRVFSWNPRRSAWEEGPMKEIESLYSVTALAWRRDGTRIACGSLCGAVLLFESVLRRTIWNDRYEVTHVGPNQLVVKTLQPSSPDESIELPITEPVIITSASGHEIDDIRLMGNDCYVVARTDRTLIVVDLQRGLVSEIPWLSSDKHARFYFDNPAVCLVFDAGALTLIEYGAQKALASVRTEFANPHLVSIRLNERPRPGQMCDSRRLAYLLDLKTVCLIDLIDQSSAGCGQISHDSKIDWLELNETGEQLLFRDRKQRLMLANTRDGRKTCLFSGVGFVQWITGTDAAVAQSASSLLVWYNVDQTDRPGVIPVHGEVYDVVRADGRTEAMSRDEVGVTSSVRLDEALLEFGTAIHDGDLGRAALFLESLGDKPEAKTMWQNLAAEALSTNNLLLAERCHAALGDVARAFCLRQASNAATEHERAALLALLQGDLPSAEAAYLEQGDIDGALNMYRRINRWDEMLNLAERRCPERLDALRDEYMALLARTGQHGRVAALLEERGDLERAAATYVRAGRPARAAAILIQQPHLMRDETLLKAVLQRLEQSGLLEAAAELHEHSGKLDRALDCYQKGGAWARAIELARSVQPERVVILEEQWADALVASGHADAAISHYIEAGRTRKALDAAVTAKQWAKAVHILHAVDDTEVAARHLDILTAHFIQAGDFDTAEKLFERAGRPEDAMPALLSAGEWERALALARQHLSPDRVTTAFVEHARTLEAEGRLREAERALLAADEADAAIAMYKRHEQLDSMVRLVERFHPDLLATTHLHLGQQLEASGHLRSAETHFLAAGEWKAALAMYRAAGQWEEAHRVARQHGGAAAAAQLAFVWARALQPDAAVRLLDKHGLLEAAVDHACDTYQFDFAFRLCRGLDSKLPDVHLRYAMALEDDGKFQEAEAEFVRAGRPREAVLMYTHSADWTNALRVAEAHAPDDVVEVLRAQAQQCLTEGRLSEFEALMLRARQPDAVVDAYREAGHWPDALRVCRDLLPDRLPALQAEYQHEHASGAGRSSAGDGAGMSGDLQTLQTLAARADEWAAAGQHARAVDCLVRAAEVATDAATVRRVLLRAAEMVRQFLVDRQAAEAARRLGPKLAEVREHTAAAQLYLSADLTRDAVDCLISADDWARARKVARELEPALESYVADRQRERLRAQGDVDQLADIDLVGALDLLAEQGQWVRCFDKARTHSAPLLHKYVAMRAAQLVRGDQALEALALFSEHGAPAISHSYAVYERVALEVFATPGISHDYNTWARLRRVLHEVVTGAEAAAAASDSDTGQEARVRFGTLLLVAHLYSVRAATHGVQSLGALAARISVALLRYSDLVPADKAYYEAGVALRALGRHSEAFVLLNHYLDVCDAVEEGDARLVDHSDLRNTDFPAEVPLPAQQYLRDEPRAHDDVREWLLAISMDQREPQTLPLDERGVYEASLLPGEQACIISGYPVLGAQPVTFQRSSAQANRDAWSKFVLAAKLAPQSHVPEVLTFIEQWCGSANPMLN